MRKETEQRFIEARNNYEENVEELKKTIEMLKADKEDEKAEYVGYILEDIEGQIAFDKSHDEGDEYVSVGQIKRDYVDYEGHKGSEQKVFSDINGVRCETSCMFEFGNVAVLVESNSEEGHSCNATKIEWVRFKDYTQKDFEILLNELYAHATSDDEENEVA